MSETNATYTDNLGLIKPDQDDDYNVDDFNNNADIIDREVTAVKTKNTEQDTAISNIQTKNTEQDTAISNIQTKNTEQDTAISNLQTKNTEQDTAITNLQNAISGQSGDISGIRTDITNLQNNKMNKNFDNATTALPINKGGTGATTAEQARQNLGLGSNATPTLGSIELVAATPFIDMHCNNTQDDYNVRLINDSDKQLTICGLTGQKIDVRIIGNLFVDGNRYKHIYIQSSFPSGAPEGSILIHQ